MKILILLLILSFNLIYISNAKVDSITDKQNQLQNNLKLSERKIDSLSSELALLKRQTDNQNELFSQTVSNISTMFDSSSYGLTIFGILFAILIIVLGVYVTYIERKVVKLRNENENLLSQTLKNKEEVVNINDLIQKDIKGLLDKIKREETLSLLNRLVNIPNDIGNVISTLLTREMEKSDFNLLSVAYKKYCNSSYVSEKVKEKYKSSYHLLFFQHFLDLSIKDEFLRDKIIKYFPDGIECAFENDILKSTNDFMHGISDLEIQNKSNLINVFIRDLLTSKFKNNEEIYKIILHKLKNREEQFIFFEVLGDKDEVKFGKTKYGKLLKDTYINSELNSNEKAIFEKIDILIADDEIKIVDGE